MSRGVSWIQGGGRVGSAMGDVPGGRRPVQRPCGEKDLGPETRPE